MFSQNINRILDIFQKKLQLDTKYFAQTSFYGGIQQSVGVICGLVISYFFGHFASKKLFGDYNFVLSIISLLTVVTLPGLDEYLVRSLGLKFNSSYPRAIRYKFFGSLIGLPILIICAIIYFINQKTDLGSSLILVALFFPFLAPLQLFNEFFTAKLKFKTIAFFLSISSILNAVLISFMVFFTHSVLLIISAYLIGIILPSLIATLYSFKEQMSQVKKDPDLLNYGIFMTLLTAIPLIANQFGQILLASLLGTELLAIYVVANKLPSYVQKSLFVFYKPLTAKLASQSRKVHYVTIKKHSLKLMLWGVLLALIVYILSPIIINFLFSSNYSDAIPYARLLSLSVLPLPFSWMLADIVIFQKNKRLQFLSSLFLSLLRIMLYLILIPNYGIMGLIISFLIDRYLSPLINLYIIYNNRKTLING